MPGAVVLLGSAGLDRNADSSRVTPLLLEEVRVDALDLVGLLEGDAEVELSDFELDMVAGGEDFCDSDT